ncbi:hypothetical protein HG530_014662 [Fusarium avenaceum]|nr:hypothetical protein HG530_014662 [Fusarium avenaceum]
MTLLVQNFFPPTIRRGSEGGEKSDFVLKNAVPLHGGDERCEATTVISTKPPTLKTAHNEGSTNTGDTSQLQKHEITARLQKLASVAQCSLKVPWSAGSFSTLRTLKAILCAKSENFSAALGKKPDDISVYVYESTDLNDLGTRKLEGELLHDVANKSIGRNTGVSFHVKPVEHVVLGHDLEKLLVATDHLGEVTANGVEKLDVDLVTVVGVDLFQDKRLIVEPFGLYDGMLPGGNNANVLLKCLEHALVNATFRSVVDLDVNCQIALACLEHRSNSLIRANVIRELSPDNTLASLNQISSKQSFNADIIVRYNNRPKNLDVLNLHKTHNLASISSEDFVATQPRHLAELEDVAPAHLKLVVIEGSAAEKLVASILAQTETARQATFAPVDLFVVPGVCGQVLDHLNRRSFTRLIEGIAVAGKVDEAGPKLSPSLHGLLGRALESRVRTDLHDEVVGTAVPDRRFNGLREKHGAYHVVHPVLALETAEVATQELRIATDTGVPYTLTPLRLLDLDVTGQQVLQVAPISPEEWPTTASNLIPASLWDMADVVTGGLCVLVEEVGHVGQDSLPRRPREVGTDTMCRTFALQDGAQSSNIEGSVCLDVVHTSNTCASLKMSDDGLDRPDVKRILRRKVTASEGIADCTRLDRVTSGINTCAADYSLNVITVLESPAQSLEKHSTCAFATRIAVSVLVPHARSRVWRQHVKLGFVDIRGWVQNKIDTGYNSALAVAV